MRQSSVLTALAAAIVPILILTACGGKQPVTPELDDFRTTQLALLDEMAAPAGVDAETWQQLKVALARLLAEPGKAVRAAPATDASAARLTLDTVNIRLDWYYACQGDYDQNGEVNIGDLTPLGLHFGESSGGGPFDYASVQSVIDGDGNGEINISDISPIGANFGRRVSQYDVFMSTAASDYPAANEDPPTLSPVTAVPLGDASGTPAATRLLFSYSIPAPLGLSGTEIFWVRPSDGSSHGTPSNMCGPGAPIQSSIQLFQQTFVNPDDSTYENTAWGCVAVTYTGVPELLYFNMTFNDIAVLNDVPLISAQGVGNPNTVNLDFDLGVPDGTVVSEGSVSYSLETVPKSSSQNRGASAESTLDLTPKLNWTTLSGDPDTLFSLPPVFPVKSGWPPGTPDPVIRKSQHVANFYVGDTKCETLEMVPKSVSMSLKFLKRVFDLPIGPGTDKSIELSAMMEACGRIELSGKPGEYCGAPENWPENKDKYMRANGYPIVTTVTYNYYEAMDALEQDYDVELVSSFPVGSRSWQVVAPVTGIVAHQSGAVDVQCIAPNTLETWVRQLTTVNQVGFNVSGLNTYYYSPNGGIAFCAWVIEKPKPQGEFGIWIDSTSYDWSGVSMHAVYAKDDGSSDMIMFNSVTKQYIAGGTTGPFHLPENGYVLAESDSAGAVATALVNGEQAVAYVTRIFDPDLFSFHTTLNYQYQLGDGSWSLPYKLREDLPGDEAVDFDSVSLIFDAIDNVPKMAWREEGTIMVCQGLDANGNTFTPVTNITGSFCDGELQCLLGPPNSIFADDGTEVTIYPDVNFATGETGTPLSLGSDVQAFDVVQLLNEIALGVVSLANGVQVVLSNDLSATSWGTFKIVIPSEGVTIDTLIDIGPAKDNGLGLVIGDDLDKALKYFGGTPIGGDTSWTTAELLSDMPDTFYDWTLSVLYYEDYDQQAVVGLDESQSHLHQYYCGCGGD